MDHFTQDPGHWSEELLEEVNKAVIADKVLFPNAEVAPEQPGSRTVQMNIHHDYRRDKMIEGVELPKHHLFRCSLGELSDNQRRLLWDIHCQKRGAIPNHLILIAPKYDEAKRSITYDGTSPWEAKVNPYESTARQIFDAWEKDFTEELARCQGHT